MHRPAGSLSLGQLRIVEIARALCLDPVLLLLDEPAAGLRHMEKRELAQTLTRLKEEGLTILLVEHDMSFVMGLTDHLVVVDFGTKIAEGRARRGARQPGRDRGLSRRRGMSAPILVLEGVSVAYGKVEAVRDVSLSHAAGQHRHRDRRQRRRQDDAAQCADGHSAAAAAP